MSAPMTDDRLRRALTECSAEKTTALDRVAWLKDERDRWATSYEDAQAYAARLEVRMDRAKLVAENALSLGSISGHRPVLAEITRLLGNDGAARN